MVTHDVIRGSVKSTLACLVVMLAVGCGRSADEPMADASPIITEECSEAFVALAEIEAEAQRTFNRDVGYQRWWASRLGRDPGLHPAQILAERYAFVVLEAPDCFPIDDRAAARQFVEGQ